MIELTEKVFEGFIIDELDTAHLLYEEELAIARKYMDGITEENRDLRINLANNEISDFYEKQVGAFFSSLKSLYRIEGAKKPEWLNMSVCEKYGKQLKDAVHEKMGRA